MFTEPKRNELMKHDIPLATGSALNQNSKGNVAREQISREENDTFANPTQGNLWTSENNLLITYIDLSVRTITTISDL